MAFLIDDDYKTLISDDDLEVVQNADDTIRLQAELAAMEYFKGYTRSRYDMDAEFELEDDARNPILVQKIMDEVLYTLHSSVPGRLVPEIRQIRKEQLDKWLEQIQKGIVTPNFTLIEDDSGIVDPGNPVRYGGQTKISGTW